MGKHSSVLTHTEDLEIRGKIDEALLLTLDAVQTGDLLRQKRYEDEAVGLVKRLFPRHDEFRRRDYLTRQYQRLGGNRRLQAVRS